MKLLICTQKVDRADPVLGFFHRWLEEFAKNCERVTVICLEKGAYDLPNNVKILSLGKEGGKLLNCYIVKWLRGWRFLKYAWKLRNDYDAVLVHMNPEYAVLGGLFWKMLKKKIGLWYVHRQVNLKLRIAGFFSDYVFSVSAGSINLKSGKLRFLGHGIDTEQFKPSETRDDEDIVRIVSVGRITRIKNLETLIEATALLKQKINRRLMVELVGEPVTALDREYDRELKTLIAKLGLDDVVRFSGARPHREMPAVYRASDLQVNLAPTGGLDKAVLEAMAAGVPVLVANQSFAETLGDYAHKLMFAYGDHRDLAEKMMVVIQGKDETVGGYLRQRVVANHNLSKLVGKIVNILAYGKD